MSSTPRGAGHSLAQERNLQVETDRWYYYYYYIIFFSVLNFISALTLFTITEIMITITVWWTISLSVYQATTYPNVHTCQISYRKNIMSFSNTVYTISHANRLWWWCIVVYTSSSVCLSVSSHYWPDAVPQSSVPSCASSCGWSLIVTLLHHEDPLVCLHLLGSQLLLEWQHSMFNFNCSTQSNTEFGMLWPRFSSADCTTQ